MNKEVPETIYDLPIQGRFLIEANAGSGKTWQMATLYVWLIAHRGLSVESIVVSTYTKSATGELQKRILDRLEEFQRELQPISHLPMELAETRPNTLGLTSVAWQTLMREVGLALDRINNALLQIERIRIQTLHGYFLSLLQNHALASGESLQANIMTDDTLGIIQKQALDFAWRQAAMTPFLAQSSLSTLMNAPLKTYFSCAPLFQQKTTEDSWWQILWIHFFPDPTNLEAPFQLIFERPSAMVSIPPSPEGWSEELINDCLTRLDKHYNTLLRERETLIAALMKGGLNQQSYKPRQIQEQIQSLLLALSPSMRLTPPHDTLMAKCMKLFDTSLKNKQTVAGKKAFPNWRAPSLFAEIESYLPEWWDWQKKVSPWIYTQLLLVVKPLVLKHFEALMATRYSLPFNEVVARVFRAFVQNESSSSLIQAEKHQTRAWLIDEFQDTDQQQWAIIKSLQEESSPEKAGLVVVVGDPKQAIFNFRGADLNAYLAARQEMSAPPLLLTSNYRATARVVHAVNAWFSPPQNEDEGTFLNRDIQYHASQHARVMHDNDPLSDIAMPYTWVVIEGTNAKRKTQALDHCLREYQALCRDHPHFSAVILVNANSQGEHVVKNADEMGIRVHFDSAHYLWQNVVKLCHNWLSALLITDPHAAWQALALTPFLSTLNADHWQALLTGSPLGEHASSSLKQSERYRKVLQQEGLWALWNTLWREDGVRICQRLQQAGFSMRDIDALQALILQLIAVSPQVATQKAWLDEVIMGRQTLTLTSAAVEPAPGILEISTIHRAKGKQWDVVFCPFMDISSSAKNIGASYFHDDAWYIILDKAGFQDDHQLTDIIAHAERQESIRKHYVMATRAVHRAYLYFAERDGKKTFKPHACDHLMSACSKAFASNLDESLSTTSHYAAWKKISADQIGIDCPINHEVQKNLPLNLPQPFPIPTPPTITWTTLWETSFTRLMNEANHDEKRDDSVNAQEEIEKNDDIERMAQDRYAGKGLGIDVHEILSMVINRRSWASKPIAHTTQQQWVASAVQKKLYHRPQDYQNLVQGWVDLTLSTPWSFLSATAETTPVSSSFVPLPDEEISEWSYTLGWSHRSQASSAQNAWALICQSLELPPLALPQDGLWRGSLDWLMCVNGRYWIVDFKSNLLPDSSQEGLVKLIREHGYHLQALIYQYALHRYLQQSKPSYDPLKHLVGVVFIFLRALVFPPKSPLCQEQALSFIPVDHRLLALMDQVFSK